MDLIQGVDSLNVELIELKPLSQVIIVHLYDKEPMQYTEIAEQLNLKPRQVLGAINKSLIRWGLAQRRSKLTKVLKKEYSLISITPKGKKYVEHLARILIKETV